ncbi:MAG: HEAT repeat domain-containing protein [Deltaproteobacteria bacterium]|nr:MAG: HEAT repeat domain-containing protein [Deltaproteobacteria bacterium]
MTSRIPPFLQAPHFVGVGLLVLSFLFSLSSQAQTPSHSLVNPKLSSVSLEQSACRPSLSLKRRVEQILVATLSYNQLVGHARTLLAEVRLGKARSRSLAWGGLGLLLRRYPWFAASRVWNEERTSLRKALRSNRGKRVIHKALVGTLLMAFSPKTWGFSSQRRRAWLRQLSQRLQRRGSSWSGPLLHQQVLLCSTRLSASPTWTESRWREFARSKDPWVRAASFIALGKATEQSSSLASLWKSLLDEEDPLARVALSQSAAKVGSFSTSSLLGELPSRNLWVRTNAADILRERGRSVFPELLRRLSSRRRNERLQAAFVLTGMTSLFKGSKAQRTLAQRLRKERSSTVLVGLLRLVGKLKPHKALLQRSVRRLRRNRNRWVRSVLVETYLQHLALYQKSLLRMLREDLRSRDRRIRLQSIAFLERMEARETLRSATKQGSLRVRAAAIWSLGKLYKDRQPPASWLQELREGLTHRSWRIRYASAEAFNEMGPRSEPAAKALVKALGDRNWGVRAASLQALRKIGANALSAMESALKSSSVRSRLVATDALGQMKGDEAKRARWLRRLLSRDRSRLVRYQALLGLFRLERSKLAGQRTLLRAVKRRDWGTREKAARLLHVFGRSKGVHRTLVRLATKDSHPAVREAAVLAFSRWFKSTRTTLEAGLKHSSWRIRAASLQTLARFGRRGRSLLSEVKELWKDRNPYVGWTAIQAAHKMGSSLNEGDFDNTPRRYQGRVALGGLLLKKSASMRTQLLQWLRGASSMGRSEILVMVRMAFTGYFPVHPIRSKAKPLTKKQAQLLLPVLFEFLAMPERGLRRSSLELLKRLHKLHNLGRGERYRTPHPDGLGFKAWMQCANKEQP